MCFLSSAAFAAAPEYMPASVMVLELSGDVTVTSKAAVVPIGALFFFLPERTGHSYTLAITHVIARAARFLIVQHTFPPRKFSQSCQY